ncbi:MAG: ATP-dependent helicase, partial [Archangium gephyra]
TPLFPGPEKVAKAAFDGDWLVERQRMADEQGVFAFDLFAGGAARVLREVESVARLIAQRYPVIIVDEFQDTNDAQWEFVQLLAARSHVVFLADPDQRIFEYDDTVDPLRLDQLRELLDPVPFDLGGDNHRSPDAGILQYANAVMRNQPLPETGDVKELRPYPRAFEATVHAAVIWSFSQMRQQGIAHPSVAVLARANSVVVDISRLLSEPHTFNNQTLSPVEHEVVWDADLTTAAALVIGSMLEWEGVDRVAELSRTYDVLGDYYEVKNSIKASTTAVTNMARFRTAAVKIRAGQVPRQQAAVSGIAGAYDTGLTLRGDPMVDWVGARDVLGATSGLSELFTNVRFVRFFRATDEIGSRLMARWRETGTYSNAPDIIRRAIEANILGTEHREPVGCMLMTAHKAKGKEFDAVVVVDGRFRGKFYEDRDEAAPYLQGRRLLRVAITRARHKVILVRPYDSIPLVDNQAVV